MVSPRKSKSSLSLPAEGRFNINSSAKSCESLYSNASSKASAGLLYRRNKVQQPGMNRQSSMVPATSEVHQRVVSARRLRIKNYQNQLSDAKQTIEDLLHENRMLETMHKRQNSALAKYESSNAELPQLLNSHSEELRMWQTKCKNLQIVNKEIEQKLKQKEAIIMSLSDQNKYFSKLNKDKNLLERQQLREENEHLQSQLKLKDDDLKVQARKLQLEIKNLKQQYQFEQKKTKNALMELENSRLELSAYSKLDQINISNNTVPRRSKMTKDIGKLEKIVESPVETASDIEAVKKYKKNDMSSDKISHPVAMMRGSDCIEGDIAVGVLKKIPKQKNQPKQSLANLNSCKAKSNAKTKIGQDTVNNPLNEIVDVECDDGSLNVICENIGVEYNDVIDDLSNQDEEEMKLAEEEFNTIRMRTDISNIRNKIMGDDYKKREQFIDGFCLQNNTVTDDEDEEQDIKEDKYRQFSKTAIFSTRSPRVKAENKL